VNEVLADLRHLYVLLVEDDTESLDFTASLLRMCGATVKALPEARQALKTVRQVTPHIVVTDIVLPEKDGYWLAEQLEAMGLAAVPVIALSGYRRIDYAHERRDRFSLWIRKPFDPVALCRAVRDAVAASVPRRRPGEANYGQSV
jgi:two-component system, chemotaxis family, CheB/CheR fusion protein